MTFWQTVTSIILQSQYWVKIILDFFLFIPSYLKYVVLDGNILVPSCSYLIAEVFMVTMKIIST